MKKTKIEVKSKNFSEVIEYERIINTEEEKKVYCFFVRTRNICKINPKGFETEEYTRNDISWPEKIKELKETQEVKIKSY